MASPSYARQTLESPNPIARFAHRTRHGFALAMVSDALPKGGTAVDFGAGPGTFVKLLRAERPDAQVVGYEPFMGTGSEHVVRDRSLLPRRADVITALEVCEHLSPESIQEFVDFMKATLSDNGTAIVSVPIMVGPILLLKNLNFVLFKKPPYKYSFRELVSGVFYKPVSRFVNQQGMYTHKGFDWRNLRAILNQNFIITKETYSPFPWLYHGLNSQWFVALKKRPAPTA